MAVQGTSLSSCFATCTCTSRDMQRKLALQSQEALISCQRNNHMFDCASNCLDQTLENISIIAMQFASLVLEVRANWNISGVRICLYIMHILPAFCLKDVPRPTWNGPAHFGWKFLQACSRSGVSGFGCACRVARGVESTARGVRCLLFVCIPLPALASVQ